MVCVFTGGNGNVEKRKAEEEEERGGGGAVAPPESCRPSAGRWREERGRGLEGWGGGVQRARAPECRMEDTEKHILISSSR